MKKAFLPSILLACHLCSASASGVDERADSAHVTWLDDNTHSLGITVFAGPLCGERDVFSPRNEVGAEVTLAKRFFKYHALTLSFLAAHGERNERITLTNDAWTHEIHEIDRDDFALMGGYCLTLPVGPHVFLSAGVKGGLDVQSFDIKDELRYEWNGSKFRDHNQDDSFSAGFSYAGYAQVGINIMEDSALVFGYQYRGATTRPKMDVGRFQTHTISTKRMQWHEFHVGISSRF